MTKRTNQIGFSQRVRLEWLEQTAGLALVRNDKAVIQCALKKFLAEKFSKGNTTERGYREKIITLLLKVWVNVPSELEPLRNEGLELLKKLPQRDHLPIHWGMVAAVYPFWVFVALQVGRLLKLQNTVSATQIQRRIREEYGERETVARSTRCVLRSYVDWGVLKEPAKKGIYTARQALVLDNVQLVSWLVEALLHAHPKGLASLKSLLESPSLFPLIVKPMTIQHSLRNSTRVELVRHGLDEDFVMLRK